MSTERLTEGIKAGGTALLVALFISAVACAADWPQLGGPGRDARSPEQNVIQQWPENGPEVLWTIDVGEGYAAPSVYDGKVYLLDRDPGKRDILRCLSLRTGEELWTNSWEAKGGVPHPGSRSQPLVGQRYVFAVGAKGDLYAVDRDGGRLLWHVNLLEQYDARQPKYGVSQCPLSYRDMIIVIPFGQEAGVAALDKETGREVWASAPFEDLKRGPYSSPVFATIDGTRQVVVNVFARTAGLDPETGEFLWGHGGWRCKRTIVSPVIARGGRILRTGGYEAGTQLLHVQKSDGRFEAKTAWKTSECNCQIHQPIIYRGYIYVMGNSNQSKGGLMCYDIDGALQWQTGRSPNFGRGGMVLANGRLFAVNARTGELVLIRPDPSGYSPLGSEKYLDPEARAWAPPVLSEGRLLIRDQHQMKCLDVRKR